MPRFSLDVQFVFSGQVDVEAASLEDAVRIVNSDLGMNAGAVHTSNEEAVKDWTFDMTPERRMTRAHKVRD